MIKVFTGEYSFLSNFFERPIWYDGLCYGSSEAAFQAQKCKDKFEKMDFVGITPAKAKKLGRKVDLRSDWNEIKVEVMYQICKAKFTQHPDLLKLLLATENQYICEGNTWHDTFWGRCNNEGKNMLGLILMKLRRELQNYQPIYYHEVMFYPSLNSICIRSYSDELDITDLQDYLADTIKAGGDNNIENIFPLTYAEAHQQFNMKNEEMMLIF